MNLVRDRIAASGRSHWAMESSVLKTKLSHQGVGFGLASQQPQNAPIPSLCSPKHCCVGRLLILANSQSMNVITRLQFSPYSAHQSLEQKHPLRSYHATECKKKWERHACLPNTRSAIPISSKGGSLASFQNAVGCILYMCKDACMLVLTSASKTGAIFARDGLFSVSDCK